MNLITSTDVYKMSHPFMYGENQGLYSYWEGRYSKRFPDMKFFGLQYILKILAKGITKEDVQKGKMIYEKLGMEFPNWQYILDKHAGKIPVEIRSIDEGTVLDYSVPAMSVESTDENCTWIVNYLETFLSQVWYPTAVCTLSYQFDKLFKDWKNKTGDEDYKHRLWDFGCRSSHCMYSSAIGAAAHLVNFAGSDTVPVIEFIEDNYGGVDLQGVRATEHSVMTHPEGELKIVERILSQNNELVSIVADSYNQNYFLSEIIGVKFKDKIIKRGNVVVRTDSGNVIETIINSTKTLMNRFGSLTNSKGYKVLPSCIRLLHGDGINYENLMEIREDTQKKKYSLDNYIFGCGSALLNQVKRDDIGAAFKSSAVLINNEWVPVSKSTPGKISKSGRVSSVWQDGKIVAGLQNENSALTLRFKNGTLYNQTTFNKVRNWTTT